MSSRWGVLAFGAALLSPSLGLAQDGAQTFQRCAACHLPDGRGVPGAYPPLAGQVTTFARTPAGRAYLVSVVDKGVTGPLSVGGTTYRGFMPAQPGLSDQALAETLNHLLTVVLKGSDSRPYTAAEVKELRERAAGGSAQQTLSMRPEMVARK